jgi:SOS-response transcriptional repressor LexA
MSGRMSDDSGQKPVDGPAAEFAALHAASGRTQADTAAYLERRLGEGVSVFKVTRWLNGQTRVPVEILDAMRELASQPTGAPAPVIALTETSDVVPLFGYANAAGASLRLNEDQRVGVVPIHPAQRGSRSAFAFIVFGDSMTPRLRHGDVGYAIRNRTPQVGQPCVIELVGGEALVKIFDRADERTIYLSQLNPKKDLSYAVREVAALHAVVGVSFGPV